MSDQVDALDNLCLTVPLPPTWTPAADIQAMSRLKRWEKLARPQAPANNDPVLLDMMKNFLGVEDMHRHFREQYLTHMPSLRDRYEERIRSDLNFVEAFEEGMRMYGEEVGMDLVIRDPKRMDPHLIQAWIWGPNGEFTGFGRINAFDEMERQALYHRSGTFDYRIERYPELSRFNFKVTVLLNIRDHRYGYPDDLSRRPSCITYVRFATYHDYAAWERVAARDPAGREYRELAR